MCSVQALAAAGDTPPAREAATQTVPAGQYLATSLMEMRVKNGQNEELGVISELLIDKQGRVSHVVLQEGGLLGMGEHRYAVPWSRVKIGDDRKTALIDVTKERLAAEFSAFEPQEFERHREPLRK
jgi:sporulation protein YlmC with PRC-barrel domain